MEALAGTGSRHHDRLFGLAMSKFDNAIRATPDNTNMIVEYAHTLTQIAQLKINAKEAGLSYFEKAFQKLHLASNMEELVKLGSILVNSKPIFQEFEKVTFGIILLFVNRNLDT